MIRANIFHKHVLILALQAINAHSVEAEALVLGTCLTESGLRAVHQQLADGSYGPARGLCQMEEATFDDHWAHFLGASRRKHITDGLKTLDSNPENFDALVYNPFLAVAFCRIHYLRKPEQLPAADNIEGQADYWKAHYNTPAGAGKPEDYIEWKHTILDIVCCNNQGTSWI